METEQMRSLRLLKTALSGFLLCVTASICLAGHTEPPADRSAFHSPLRASNVAFPVDSAMIETEVRESRLALVNWQGNEPAKIVLVGVPRGARIDIDAREVRSNKINERHFVTAPVPVGEKTFIRVTIRGNGRAAKLAVQVEGGKTTRQKAN
jgi:hypothetical protein